MRVSLFHAFITMLDLYVSGVPLMTAYRNAFFFRRIVNAMVDFGFTEEQIVMELDHIADLP